MKKALLVSETETFTVKGLEMKLKGIGVTAVYSSPKIAELGQKIQDTELVFLYTDDNASVFTEAIIFIKDHCAATGEKVAIIGGRAEFEILKKLLSDEYIMQFFERPLDMGNFLETVEDFLSEESKMARRKSILIVDDDVQYMTMIVDWLKDVYRVSMANSGMSAITWLANNRADLILLDYEMPITSGPQVLQMIRSEASTQDIPVMFLTGNASRESIMKVLSLKPADYLLKTIDKAGLHEKIDNFFVMQSVKK